MSGELHRQRQGTDRDYGVTVFDATEAAVTEFTGSEPLTALIWPGDQEAPAATLSAVWTDAATGSITLTVAASAIASLAVQPWPIVITVLYEGRTFEVWRGWLDVLAGVGAEAAIPVYGSFADMILYSGDWVKQLLTVDSTSGFAVQRGRARSRLEEIILARWRPWVPGMHRDLLDGIGWYTLPEAPDPCLMAYLAAGDLIIRPKTLEIVARLAVGYACEQPMGALDGSNPYYMRGQIERVRAEALIATYAAELDINGDGLADFVINCGVINTRRVY
jgi:hypothetical protein